MVESHAEWMERLGRSQSKAKDGASYTHEISDDQELCSINSVTLSIEITETIAHAKDFAWPTPNSTCSWRVDDATT